MITTAATAAHIHSRETRGPALWRAPDADGAMCISVSLTTITFPPSSEATSSLILDVGCGGTWMVKNLVSCACACQSVCVCEEEEEGGHTTTTTVGFANMAIGVVLVLLVGGLSHMTWIWTSQTSRLYASQATRAGSLSPTAAIQPG